MSMAARFEVVQTDAGFHARFIGSNGEPVWWTETYARKVDALQAVRLIYTFRRRVVLAPPTVRTVDEREVKR